MPSWSRRGFPILAGIYGTNPAGGGYQGISPTILLAHKDANIAVGGVGIVSGMSPKGGFDVRRPGGTDRQDARHARSSRRAGSRPITTRPDSSRACYDEENEVLDGIKEYMRAIPAYDPMFFRVAEPEEPQLPANDLYHLLPFNQKEAYIFDDILARLVDGSEHMEFRPDYGPEMYTGLVKIDGMLIGAIGNRQGLLPKGYPEYADYPGIGGKLYRQGLIKMNEFVTLCGRDRVPIIWFQDTTGIDVGDIAEKAELLGLGQSLIYSIQQTDVPMMLVVLRKGSAAAHYIMGGPTANRHNAFTLGTAATEIYVMHGETAAVATYARRAVKEKDAGRPLAADRRKDERDGEEVLRHVAPGLLRPATALSTRSSISRRCAATSRPLPARSIRTQSRSARATRCCCRGSSGGEQPQKSRDCALNAEIDSGGIGNAGCL